MVPRSAPSRTVETHMLAMQYSFTLPADYDMDIIRRRIAAKGSVIDGLPGLGYKAYIYACRGEHGPENLYAPFYLWHQSEAMSRFFGGSDIFANVTGAFGWPAVKLWSVLHTTTAPNARDARHLSRELLPIAPHTALTKLHEAELELAQAATTRQGALAAVTGFDPTTWTLVRTRLWRERPTDLARPGTQLYELGYLSLGAN